MRQGDLRYRRLLALTPRLFVVGLTCIDGLADRAHDAPRVLRAAPSLDSGSWWGEVARILLDWLHLENSVKLAKSIRPIACFTFFLLSVGAPHRACAGPAYSYFDLGDLPGGPVDAGGFANQHIKSGKIVGVATTTLKCHFSMPDLPTFAEAGVQGYDVSRWFGLILRAGTPPDVVAKLSDALRRPLQAPEVRDRIAETGEVPQGTTSEFAELLAREYPHWSPTSPV